MRTNRDWTPWHLDVELRVLWTNAGGYYYEIDLDTCTTPAEVLDWICQIAGKQWETPATLGLVNALNDILHPQAHLCSSGQSKTITRPRIRALVAEWSRFHRERAS